MPKNKLLEDVNEEIGRLFEKRQLLYSWCALLINKIKSWWVIFVWDIKLSLRYKKNDKKVPLIVGKNNVNYYLTEVFSCLNLTLKSKQY